MRISQDGIDLITEFEGCSYTAYQDSTGTWTIGYGHTANVTPSMEITPEQAEEFLSSDLLIYEHYVNLYVTAPLTQNQFDALVSFTYNVGPGTLRHSTLLNVLNTKGYAQAADLLLEYDHAGGVEVAGLLRRRQAERAMFLTPPSTSWYRKFLDWAACS